MYQQNGVDRVMVNPATDIVVFTFFPVKTSAGSIVSNFQTAFHYPAQRYLPSEEEMKSGCPAMAQSFTTKLSGVFKHIF
ncbi:hypothetical protein [Chitinophaga pinensis]|uniref:Uncharacterized protein n=1 Tax=Chitinophaga pinensis TaxID=79329 RepID=A0A5C6LJM9_9BACT|nr:hypothetical protein [Chitinophaga pinensis]TWV94351.1 hypothetical protein FEF09_25795 [Chitinophaga pinensis]